jgi:hypothetical protein
MADDSGKFFAVSRKGYDPGEVDAFLAKKAKEDAERAELIATLEARVKQLNTELTVAKDDTERVGELETELATATERATALEAQAAEATAQVQGLESELTRLREQEEAIRLTLVSATKTKDEMLEAAERQLADATAQAEAAAREILDRAHAQAETTVAHQREEVAALQAELDRLADERSQHLIKLKHQSDSILAEREHALDAQAAAFEAEHADLVANIAALGGHYEDLAGRLRAIAAATSEELATGQQEINQLVEANPVVVRTRAVTMTPAPQETFETPPPTMEPHEPVVDHHVPEAEQHAAEHHEPEAEQHEAKQHEAEQHEAEQHEAERHEAEQHEAERHEAEHHEAEHYEPEAEHFQPVDDAPIESEGAHHEPEPVEADSHEPAPVEPEAEMPHLPEEEATDQDRRHPEDDESPEITINDDLDDDGGWRREGDGADRGSFYSRRSGKLPRLGADASRSALTAALSMRRSGQDEDDD